MGAEDAADVVIALGQEPDGWAVMFAMRDGELHVKKGLTWVEARHVIREQWYAQIQQMREGLRFGTRKVGRDTWVLTDRCPDGVVRAFTSIPRKTQRSRQSMPIDVRFKVLERDGFRCRYCGRGADEVRLHVDHVHPVSAGGTNDLDNLVAACQDCNLGKKARVGVSPSNSSGNLREPAA